MSLFTTFALGAAQGAAQGAVQGAVARMQMDMEEAKARIQEARDRTMLKLNQDFQRDMAKENRDFTESRDTARFDQQNALEESRNARHQADLELKERLAMAKDEREREIVEKRHQQTLAAIGAREGKSRGVYDTTVDGEKVYIEGDKARRVSFDDGKPVKTLKNLSDSDKMDLSGIRSQIQTLMKNPPLSPKERPAYDRQLQDLRREEARLTGRSSAAAAPTSADDFLASILGAPKK
jgi:hypothetical protein